MIGLGSGRSCAAPETVLGDYDLVFAKGRAALEALAIGTAVIVCDAAGLGGMVCVDNLAEVRCLNFGIRALRKPITAESITREILRYARGIRLTHRPLSEPRPDWTMQSIG